MRIIKHIGRLLLLWLLLGMCYATLELLFRGVTYRLMIFIGGLAGLLVGLLNEHPAYYNRRMWQQCFLGTLITLVIEFVSGYIFNLKLHLQLWDYSGSPYNFEGQICLQTAIAWFFLMPLAIYADDWLRWKFFGKSEPSGGPLNNYALLFTGR